MTASSPSGPAQLTSTPLNSLSRSTTSARHQNIQTQHQQQHQSSYTASNHSSTLAFQQVKQTQASLARQSHVHQQLQAAVSSNNHNNISIGNSNHAASGANLGNNISQNQLQQQQSNHVGQTSHNSSQSSQQQKPAATFVDCLIRRFKNCFNEDFCTVPMFVVGNLSPGIDACKLQLHHDAVAACSTKAVKINTRLQWTKRSTLDQFISRALIPGTHLILPPCVSLGRQGINRFSSPKNLRLMNSIRESCRSIEELDLGGNKLNDLIEVYKILQLTPNLRFLNLSENDLSRTAPVAMATSSTYPTASVSPSLSSSSSLYSSSIGGHSATTAGQWTQASGGGQRACLAPLNQNMPLGARRHSSLGHTISSSLRARNANGATKGPQASGASRVEEVRRLAAANALAQSKKTSSSVASKLASSAVAAASSSSIIANQAAHHMRPTQASQPTCSRLHSTSGAARRNQTSGAPSTMHLARSLSSLSAKDLRGPSAHRAAHMRGDARQSLSGSSVVAARRRGSAGKLPAAPQIAKNNQDNETTRVKTDCKVPSSSSHQLLYVEPTIVETDDVDMSSEQQVSPGGGSAQTAAATGSANQQGQKVASSSASNSAPNQAQQQPPQSARAYSSPIPLPLFNQATSTGNQVNNNSNNSYTSFRRTFESIKALALNNTGCPWRVVCSILSRMPNLQELHLSLNNYEKIDLEPNEFRHHSLRRLYLCNNPKLTNWEELDKLLIAFPSLEALSIANCNISQIPDNLDRAREWRKLCGLNINGWPIKEWPVVERLNQLPSLIDLKCRNLEVLNTIDEPRHHLIARLPKLQRLNGSEIEEREEAEKAFVRFFMANSHLERPSRFHELMQIYGEISTVDVDVDLSPPSQAQVRVIYLNRNHYRKENNDDIMMSEDFLLKLMDNAESGSNSNNVVQQPQQEIDSANQETATQENNMEVAVDSAAIANKSPVRLFKDEGQEIVELNVDLRQSVRKFKSNLASLFGLDGQNLILYYIDHEMVGLMGAELLKHNQKKLWNYNVQDGDQFIVEEL